MAKCDAVVIGAGPAGLTAGAILAKEGKKVVVLERSKEEGGRRLLFPYRDGYRLYYGGSLMEDPGDGATRIMEYVGKSLVHGPINDCLPVYTSSRKWVDARELYQKDKPILKRLIAELVETDWSAFDELDDVPLRTWMLERTTSESVIASWEFISLLERLTGNWYDHSASDNLYTRKAHYQISRKGGYSFVPVGGWEKVHRDLVQAVRDHGGEVRFGRAASSVIIENGRVLGVEAETREQVMPIDCPEREVLEAPSVICALPVWNALSVVPEGDLPRWYADRLKLCAQDSNRTAWFGVWAGADEPIYALTERELTAWERGLRTGFCGWCFQQSAVDDTCAPPGKHLFVAGAVFDAAAHLRDLENPRWVGRMFQEFDQELTEMVPRYKKVQWKEFHLAYKPIAYCVIQKTGLVGRYRPGNEVPGVEGLYFAGDTYKSRMIGSDSAMRSGLTCAELILGRRLPFFKDTWHY